MTKLEMIDLAIEARDAAWDARDYATDIARHADPHRHLETWGRAILNARGLQRLADAWERDAMTDDEPAEKVTTYTIIPRVHPGWGHAEGRGTGGHCDS